jgi:zinc transport system substrate-binding protein
MITILNPATLRSLQSRTLLIFVGLALATVGAGCGVSQAEADADAKTVLAAFYPLAFAAERVVGPATDVHNLTPPGVEPHDLELSPRDVERVRAANVVLYLGGGFQPALEEALDGADGEAVDLLAGLELRRGPDEDEPYDPHVWLDPVRFAAVVERIGRVLDRPRAAARLNAELRSLDRSFRRGLARCDRRTVVTSHDAFGYLTSRYGLAQLPITGVSPEAEPTPRDLERVARSVRRSGATTVFFETLVSPRLAETVARETGAEVALLDPLEGLSEEDLERGANYFSVMRANLGALREALECR